MIQGDSTYYFVYNAHPACQRLLCRAQKPSFEFSIALFVNKRLSLSSQALAGRGDVTALTDQNGEVVATYEYDEFGNTTSSTGTIYNPIRYSGANNAYYDEETGLYKMGVRYYQSDIGRWLTRDDYEGEQENPQSKNRYVYVENSPTNMADSTGHWGDDVHYKMTKMMAELVPIPQYAKTIAQGSKDMDNKYNWAGSKFPKFPNLKYHYDLNGSIKQRLTKTKKTAIYYLKKRNKRKAYWWLGMGLHSLQDSYSHPRGKFGVVKHTLEGSFNMLGRKASWSVPAAKLYSIHGSTYDEPRNNRNNYNKAYRATFRTLLSFQSYCYKKRLIN